MELVTWLQHCFQPFHDSRLSFRASGEDQTHHGYCPSLSPERVYWNSRKTCIHVSFNSKTNPWIISSYILPLVWRCLWTAAAPLMATSNVRSLSQVSSSHTSNEQEFSYLWRGIIFFCVNILSTPIPWGSSSLWAVLITVHFYQNTIVFLSNSLHLYQWWISSTRLNFFFFFLTSSFWSIIYLQGHHLCLFKFYTSFGFHFRSCLRHKIFQIFLSDSILQTLPRQRQTKNLDKTTPELPQSFRFSSPVTFNTVYLVSPYLFHPLVWALAL